jgi:phage repressor protein C with HTH and peptisase S24 domain
MKISTPAGRLQWARQNHGRYKTATDAARAYGWPVSTYLGHENGDRSPSREAAKKYAKAYKVRWEWLLEGEGKPTLGRKTAHAVGYVGAGAEVVLVDDYPQGGGFEEVEVPPGLPEDAVLVVVRGDSMHPRYFDNEYLFYIRRNDDPRTHLGKESVVKLADGRIFVKVIRRGSNDQVFNLESWNPSTPTLEDVMIEWAAPVLARVNRAS